LIVAGNNKARKGKREAGYNKSEFGISWNVTRKGWKKASQDLPTKTTIWFA